jgi:LysM repeat protein
MIFFLLIPITICAETDPQPFIEVTVVKGDYLIAISERYLADPRQWMQIAKINKVKNPDIIFPGQMLIIPVELLRGIPIEGIVKFIRGNADVQEKEGAEWKKLFLNDRIVEGSSLRTQKESEVEIQFKNGDSWDQRSDSTANVTSARQKGDFALHKLFLRIGKSITTIKKATGRESRFEIDTPSAVCAAKGTEFRTSVDEYEATRSEVLEGTIDIEAYDQRLSINEGEGVLVKKGEPPQKPRKLLLPPQVLNIRAIYKRLPLELAFQKIEGAISYRVVLARDREIRDVLKEMVIQPDDMFTFSQLDEGTYYLQTQSIDSIGLEGLSSQPIEINIRVNPVPPFIQTPIEGGEYREKTLLCKWLQVKDAVVYNLQIAEDAKFNTVVQDRSDIQDTEYKIEVPDYKDYYFRVSSVAKDRFEGEWSDTIRFKITPPPPTPQMSEPEMTEKEIHIRWPDLGSGYSYHFQMSADKTFPSTLVDEHIKEAEITIKTPKKPGTYYVRTSSIDSRGYEGSFSAPQSFEIKRGLFLEFLGLTGILGLIFFLL